MTDLEIKQGLKEEFDNNPQLYQTLHELLHPLCERRGLLSESDAFDVAYVVLKKLQENMRKTTDKIRELREIYEKKRYENSGVFFAIEAIDKVLRIIGGEDVIKYEK